MSTCSTPNSTTRQRQSRQAQNCTLQGAYTSNPSTTAHVWKTAVEVPCRQVTWQSGTLTCLLIQREASQAIRLQLQGLAGVLQLSVHAVQVSPPLPGWISHVLLHTPSSVSMLTCLLTQGESTRSRWPSTARSCHHASPQPLHQPQTQTCRAQATHSQHFLLTARVMVVLTRISNTQLTALCVASWWGGAPPLVATTNAASRSDCEGDGCVDQCAPRGPASRPSAAALVVLHMLGSLSTLWPVTCLSKVGASCAAFPPSFICTRYIVKWAPLAGVIRWAVRLFCLQHEQQFTTHKACITIKGFTDAMIQ